MIWDDDLEADPLQADGHLRGMDAGVPDVADLEGWDQSERLGPVGSRVAAERGVAMADGAPVAPRGRRGGVIGVGRAIDPHVRPFGGTQGVVDAVAPGRVERHAVWRIGREERRLRTVEQAGHVLRVGGIPDE